MKVNAYDSLSYAANQSARKSEGQISEPPGQVKKELTGEKQAKKPQPDQVELGEKVPGVIRLLQEGHFKGVADVRLRISHFEQINALNQEATAAQSQAGVEEFAGKLGEELGKLQAGLSLTEEQQAGFQEIKDTLQQAVAAAEAAGADGTAAKQSLQEAFATFVEGLSALLAPPPPEEPAPEIPIVETPEALPEPEADEILSVAAQEPPDTQTPPAVDPVEVFKAAFAEALSGLEASFAPVSVLPEVAPGSGHGTAYDKFLAQYQQLYGITATTEEAVNLQV